MVEAVKDPLIDFVGMEFDLAGDLCSLVDTALNALKKVTLTYNVALQVFNRGNSLDFRYLGVVLGLQVDGGCFNTGIFFFRSCNTLPKAHELIIHMILRFFLDLAF